MWRVSYLTPEGTVWRTYHDDEARVRKIADSMAKRLRLLPPNGAQGWTGVALLVICGADFYLIPFLLQSSHVVPIRPRLDAGRRRACLEGVGDEFKALVQKCADLWVVCGYQRKIGLFLVFCHAGLPKEAAVTRRYVWRRHDTTGMSSIGEHKHQGFG
jgi:hypothetical protein